MVKKLRLGQSMFGRGNCWDNVLQESFVGILKMKHILNPARY